MQGRAHVLLMLLAAVATSMAAGQEPPAADIPANPPTPTPPVTAPVVIAGPTSSSGFLRLDQPQLGPILPPGPAQNLAMLEAGQPVAANDPLVRSVAVLLKRLTAMYVEDAPRISELTIRLVRDLRATNQSASVMETLTGATQWSRSPSAPGNIPRKFEEFAARYRKLRIVDGKDHAAALSLMQPPTPRPPDAQIP